MKFPSLHLFIVPLVALSCAASAQTTANAPDSPPAPDETVQLSPFEVHADKDEGYQASETLSGTRLKTKVEDTGVAETIITPDFMRDLGITALDEVYKFVPNTTSDDPQLGTVASNSSLFSSVAYTSRGFSIASAQRDFLPTSTPADIYNTERISFTRGPNSILYGLGNPGGISNAVSQHANVDRQIYRFDILADTNDGFRTSFNLNVPIIQHRLALRYARLDSDRGSYLKPDENISHRNYATLRFQPWQKTIFDVRFEQGEQDRRAMARGYTYSDSFSSWTTLPEASRPRLTTPGSYTAATPIAGLDQLTAANSIFLIDGAGGAVDPMNWSRMAKTRVATPALNNAIHGVSGSESFALPFPVTTNLMGYADGTQVEFREFTASLQQNILPDLDVELTYNHQYSDRFADYSMPAANDTLRVDPNFVLPSGAPNPNYGKYYYDAGSNAGVIFIQKNTIDVARATVSYELDFKKYFPKAGRWLGRHRFAGLIERDDNPFNGVNNAQLGNLTPTKTSVPGLAATWPTAPGSPTNILQYRFYFDPAAGITSMPSLWDKYPYLATSDNIASLQSTLTRGANGVTPGFVNRSAPILRDTVLDTRIFAMQNYWLNDRLITLFGWRRDTQTQYVRNLPVDAATLLYPDPEPYDARDGGTKTVSPGSTYTRGVVLVAAKWLRLFYNESSSLVLQSATASDLYSRPINNSDGKGSEMGLRFSWLDGRIQGSISHWETNLNGQSIATLRNQLGLFNFVTATNLLWSTAATISGDNKYLAAPYTPAQAFTDYQDYVAKGYEFTLTANPTRNWRVMLNAGQQVNHQSNIGPVLREYWAEYEPVWRNFQGNFLSQPGGAQASTIAGLLDLYGAGVDRIVAATGVSTASIPKWSGNFVTNYTFNHGALKNVGVGGSLNYASPRTIGYLLTPDGLYRPDAPIRGNETWNTGLWLSYSRKFKLYNGRSLQWRVQLNARNIFNKRDLEPVNGLDDGTGEGVVIRWRVPEPRTFVLSSSFTF